MRMIINPGTGPVGEACEEAAQANMGQFLKDAGLEEYQCLRTPERDYDKEYGDGRFAFLIWRDRSIDGCEIQMPGIPLPRVRYVNAPDQNIWHFPRLYVDGNSWVWMFAVSNARDFFGGEEEER